MDHVNDFFVMLRTELAFYVAYLRLYDRLKTLYVPICFPNICTDCGLKGEIVEP